MWCLSSQARIVVSGFAFWVSFYCASLLDDVCTASHSLSWSHSILGLFLSLSLSLSVCLAFVSLWLFLVHTKSKRLSSSFFLCITQSRSCTCSRFRRLNEWILVTVCVSRFHSCSRSHSLVPSIPFFLPTSFFLCLSESPSLPLLSLSLPFALLFFFSTSPNVFVSLSFSFLQFLFKCRFLFLDNVKHILNVFDWCCFYYFAKNSLVESI